MGNLTFNHKTLRNSPVELRSPGTGATPVANTGSASGRSFG